MGSTAMGREHLDGSIEMGATFSYDLFSKSCFIILFKLFSSYHWHGNFRMEVIICFVVLFLDLIFLRGWDHRELS